MGRMQLDMERDRETKAIKSYQSKKMKSPWKRRKKAGVEKGNVGDKVVLNTQKKVVVTSPRRDQHPIEDDDHGDIVNNNSCDDTALFSYGSTITGDKSHLRQHLQRAAVDAPGWINNTAGGSSINPPNVMPYMRTASAPQSSGNGAVSEWPPESTSIASRSIGSRSLASRSLTSRSLPTSQSIASRSAASRSIVSRGSISRGRRCGTVTSNSSSTAYPSDVSRASRRSVKHKQGPRPRPMNTRIERTASESTTDEDFFEALSKCSSGSVGGSSNSMPPPDFVLPRKEVIDAIKYHHKLGRALSELALNPEQKCVEENGKNGPVYSLALTNSNDNSTVDSSRLGGLEFVNSACGGLGASNPEPGYRSNNNGGGTAFQPAFNPMNNLSSKQWTANFDNVDIGLEQVSSMESASTSSSSACSGKTTNRSKKLEQHLSFLESHMMQQFSSSDASPPNNGQHSEDSISPTMSYNTTSISKSNDDTFFPIMDDLRSPPMSACSSDVAHDEEVLAYENFVSKSATTRNNDRSPMCMASPPSTPMTTLNMDGCSKVAGVFTSPDVEWNDDGSGSTMHQQDLDNALNGAELVEDLRRIKDETASMMLEIKDKIRSDIKATMDKEMEQHRSKLKSTVSEMSERLENAVQFKLDKMESRQIDKENEHPQCSPSRKIPSSFLQRQSQFLPSSHHSTDKKTPRNPAPENAMDSEALLKTLEKSFQSMEASIMNKITTQMDKDALDQRQAMEDIIEEKVSRVIAGSSLEIKLAVQEVKKETERVFKMALRERTPPPPPRGRTPPRRMSSMKRSGVISPGHRTHMPSPRSSSGKKNDKRDKSWIHNGISTGAKSVTQEPEKRSLEDSFAETMRVIDEFVDDCDDIADDFDKIAFRMQDADVPSDPDCDDFEYLGYAN